MKLRPGFLAVACIAFSTPGLVLADSKAEVNPDGYKTVDSAIAAPMVRDSRANLEAPTVYLGILLDPDSRTDLVIVDVDSDSPASRAGVLPGDALKTLDGRVIRDGEEMFEVLQKKSPGEALELELSRQGKPVNARAILTTWSRTMSTRDRLRSGLGVLVAAGKAGEGVRIERVAPGSPADRAKLKVGEILLKVDDVALTGPDQLYDLIDSKPSEGTVVITLLLAEKSVELKVKLDAAPGDDGRPGGTPRPEGQQRGGGYWTKPSFRLAIVCVEYPDVKHNPQITTDAWEQLLFSEGTYTKTNATGQAVHGSFRDYFLEQSCGYFRVDGKVFDWVEVGKKREEYATGNRTALLTESLDKLLARDGKEALKDFDGVFFVYAGSRFQAPRGSLYWPHRASVGHEGKRWPYFICEEGGPRMQGLSVLCHEFGHMLGMPDLYARPENPGMEGLGSWCNMSQQPNRMIPEHFGPWVKEKLGWLKPTVIDPTVKQKLILAPIEKSSKECFKIPVRADGSEYILLENRRKVGFDQILPAEGLLIWHVLRNRPTLKESHGIEGPMGPRVLLTDVPYRERGPMTPIPRIRLLRVVRRWAVGCPCRSPTSDASTMGGSPSRSVMSTSNPGLDQHEEPRPMPQTLPVRRFSPRLSWWTLMGLVWALIGVQTLAEGPKSGPDLSGYRTVREASTREIIPPRAGQAGATGYLGVSLIRDDQGRLVVDEVQPGSPAAGVSVEKGDCLVQVDGESVKTPEAVRASLQRRSPGESVKLALDRGGRRVEAIATLASTSRPRTLGVRAYLGAILGEAKEGEGVRIERVEPGSPAAEAGFKPEDRIFQVEGVDFTGAQQMNGILQEKRPGDVFEVMVHRDGADVALRPRVTADTGGGNAGPPGAGAGRPGGGQGRGAITIPLWTKPEFRVAVIGIEYPDIKHNPKLTTSRLGRGPARRGDLSRQEGRGRPGRARKLERLLRRAVGRRLPAQGEGL